MFQKLTTTCCLTLFFRLLYRNCLTNLTTKIKIMLRIMNGLPENVLGVSAEGKITASDYEAVSIPAIKKIKKKKNIKLLYHLGSNFTGFDPNTMMVDAKLGMNYLSNWDKIALVSDHHMVNNFAKFRSEERRVGKECRSRW